MRSKDFIMFGFALLFVSFAFFYIETSKYAKNIELTDNFPLNYQNYSVEMDESVKLYINKYSQQKVELIGDNTLGDQVKVVIEYPNTSVVTLKTVKEEINRQENIKLYITSDMNVTRKELKNIMNLGILSIRDKTKYNYSLLKYGNIYVYANNNLLDNVVLVDYGYFDEK